jgi:hypothetical protein
MKLSGIEIRNQFNTWLIAWNDHDLNGVMDFMHDDIIFNSWSGAIISGKTALTKSWERWFSDHQNFKFTLEDLIIDENEQKMSFSWELDWPSFEKKYSGKREKRKGVDVLLLKEGKIYKKNTYSKTTLQIDSLKVRLQAL